MSANLKVLDVKSQTTQPFTNYQINNPTTSRQQNTNPKRRRKPKKSNAKNHAAEAPKNGKVEDDCYDCVELSQALVVKPVEMPKGTPVKLMCKKENRRIRIYSFITSVIPVVFGSVAVVNGGSSPKKFFVPVNKVKAKEDTSKKSAKKKPRWISNKKAKPFDPYLTDDEISSGLEKGELIKGFIRINPNGKESYINNPDRSLQDFVIPTTEDRNRALEGDEVVFQLKPTSELKDGEKITAKVVRITREIHSRLAVGYLKLMPDRNRTYAAFTPRDGRIPRIRVSSLSWPQNFYKNPAQYENTLFLAKITEWSDVRFALGTVLENLGQSGELKAETAAILREFELDVTPYGPEMSRFLKFPPISDAEMESREDWRKECVFTIDPESARDLDDALSCRELDDGNFEVGVHISDAAFFLQQGNKLDEIVRKKATTVYLVDSTYHMLPLEMCLNCSLLPGMSHDICITSKSKLFKIETTHRSG